MKKNTLALPEEWQPHHTNDLISKLEQPEMLRLCGEWMLEMLNSPLYWNRLRRRIDMMAFAIIQEGRLDGDMRPSEQEPITADMLFSALVEPHIKRGAESFTHIWLVDDLFRLMVLDQVESLPKYWEEYFVYFSAPYFNCSPYRSFRFGEDWLDQLTEDVFREPLQTWTHEIRESYLDLMEGEHRCPMSLIYFRENLSN